MKSVALLLASLLWLTAFSQAQTPTIAAVTSAAFTSTPAPDGLVTIFGSGMSDAVYSAKTIPLPTQLGPTTVSFCDSSGNCSLVPLLYVSPTQINFYAPPNLDTQSEGIVYAEDGGYDANAQYQYTQNITVANGSQSATFAAAFQPVSPSMFVEGWDCDTYPPDGDTSPCGLSATQLGLNQVQRGSIIDLNGHLITSQNPARVGPYYSVYLTGLDLQGYDPNTEPLFIGWFRLPLYGDEGFANDASSGVSYAGESSFAGLQQVNFQIPSYLFGGNTLNSYPEWPCATYHFELGLVIEQGVGDPQAIYLPILIEPGDVPCS